MENIIVTIAKTSDEITRAHELVEIQYDEKLKVDISKLHLGDFNFDVLLAYTENEKKLVGTMRVMYPNSKEIYPRGALFGVNLKNRKLVQNNYVEIGRFATNEIGRKNRKVVISLFLGAIEHLQKKKMQGWTAIVKNNIFDFLKSFDLPIYYIRII